jgi:hypothetical protein
MNNFFLTKIDLVNAAKNWASQKGFYLSISSSNSERVTLICVKGGKHRKNGEPTRTIKCESPFILHGRKQASGQWKAIISNPHRNHPPISAASVPAGRQLSDEQKS